MSSKELKAAQMNRDAAKSRLRAAEAERRVIFDKHPDPLRHQIAERKVQRLEAEFRTAHLNYIVVEERDAMNGPTITKPVGFGG